MKKNTLKNADGSINGKLLSAFISLGILAIQLLLQIFHIKFTGDWATIVLLIDIALIMLGMLGVVTNVQFVDEPSSDETKQITEIANEVADDAENPSTTKASSDTSTSSSLNEGSKHA